MSKLNEGGLKKEGLSKTREPQPFLVELRRAAAKDTDPRTRTNTSKLLYSLYFPQSDHGPGVTVSHLSPS